MKILKFKEIENQLLELMNKQVLVPVLGAGFTRNEKTLDGTSVPDGILFKQIMIDELIKHEKLNNLKDELEKNNFNQVSNYFFNDEFITLEQRKIILRKFFLNVKLPDNKKLFLNKSIWPYIYTFNIDDAIEHNSKFRVVLPYKALDPTARDAGCVYKIHGDVFHEITYNESSNLIFSEPQYIASLMKNKSMLNFLRSDLFDNNLIFIGCSLESEIDLMYALSNNTDEYNHGALRILVTRKIPKNVLEEFNYEKYGINTIIHIDDYDEFYNQIIQLQNKVNKDENKVDAYAIYKINGVKKLGGDKNKNLDCLLQSAVNVENNVLIKPDYIIERSIGSKILKSAVENSITIIKGRRFSGKSYLALYLAEKNKHKDCYYFPSTMKIDQEILLSMIKKENALIIFDSNVLDQEQAFLIKKSFDNLKKHKTSVVIVCSNMETDIANTFLHLDYEYEFYYEISNQFDPAELTKINESLSALGIIEFKNKQTMLDNVYSTKDTYPSKVTLRLNKDDINFKEAQLLIILSVFDKVYTPVCTALGLKSQEWNAFVNKFAPLVEFEETSFAEREQHSRTKIVVNSKVWLNQLLKEYHWTINQSEILYNIQTIIETFKGHGQYQLIQQRVMMLDSLNGIMGKDGGSYKLMRYIYENLQQQLSDSPDYWLQRAKVIYKLEKFYIDAVKDAIDFAKKAYFDGKRSRTINNAEFMVALLYSKLCIMQKFHDIEAIKNAIEWFYNAIKTHEYNKDYVNAMLVNKESAGGTFITFCQYLDAGAKPAGLLPLSNQINTILAYKK